MFEIRVDKAEIFFNGHIEDKWLLRNNTDISRVNFFIVVKNVFAVDSDFAMRWFIETKQEFENGRFSGARFPYDTN